MKLKPSSNGKDLSIKNIQRRLILGKILSVKLYKKRSKMTQVLKSLN